MPRLTYKEIEQAIQSVSLAPGESVYINHANCPAGEDRKRRLCITRNDYGHILFCHHCSHYGYHWEAFARVKQRKAAASAAECGTGNANISKCFNSKLPNDLERDIGAWPRQARDWLNRADLRHDEILACGVAWSSSRKRLLLPVLSSGGILVGYQERRILPEDEKPKYLTTVFDKDQFFYVVEHDYSKTVCIVEDILSAVKVGRYTNSVGLLGSSLSDHIVEYLIKYNNFLIWLDNDNRQIKTEQRRIARRLEMFGDVRIILTDKDPKECTDQELRSEIYGV